jgi:hypothetical protein
MRPVPAASAPSRDRRRREGLCSRRRKVTTANPPLARTTSGRGHWPDHARGRYRGRVTEHGALSLTLGLLGGLGDAIVGYRGGERPQPWSQSAGGSAASPCIPTRRCRLHRSRARRRGRRPPGNARVAQARGRVATRRTSHHRRRSAPRGVWQHGVRVSTRHGDYAGAMIAFASTD